jgi:hypothetical protein
MRLGHGLGETLREGPRTTGSLARLVFHVVCVIMVITKPTLGQGSIALPSLSDVR